MKVFYGKGLTSANTCLMNFWAQLCARDTLDKTKTSLNCKLESYYTNDMRVTPN